MLLELLKVLLKPNPEFGASGIELVENPFEFDDPPKPGGSGIEFVEKPPEELDPGGGGIEEVVNPDWSLFCPEKLPKLFCELLLEKSVN